MTKVFNIEPIFKAFFDLFGGGRYFKCHERIVQKQKAPILLGSGLFDVINSKTYFFFFFVAFLAVFFFAAFFFVAIVSSSIKNHVTTIVREINSFLSESLNHV